ncbi:ABC transporter ATP-binding protein [Leucobacter insecticola]|uniref:ABC transporter ATP-binding protein n=1 Tax=Leucobacter insecticola TaxID=2714934 RepID=A0A6G8FGF5_9MICO|nr:ABC transporter ATP-binding protein [Leucobacter insecticola]QIM15425.1 ABC transporter ATP-binding protein [Leucobacter insecticola]
MIKNDTRGAARGASAADAAGHPADPVLRIEDLHKRYRGRNGAVASAGVNLSVNAGEIVGLLGHNGAGKTSLVNQIVGLVRPDSGRVTLAGIDAIAHPSKARALSCVQAQANVPITGLTPRSAIAQVGQIRGLSRAEASANTDALIEGLDLGPWANVPAQKISGGIARLTAFAMAVVAPGALVVLDEPTNDVDPVRRQLLWTQIRAIADAGSAVLLVTHNVREAEHVIDRAVILDHGHVVREGSRAEVLGDLNGHLVVEVDLAGEDVAWPDAVTPLRNSAYRKVAALPQASADAVIRWAEDRVRAGSLLRYAIAPISLEDVYIDVVGPAADTEHATEEK